MLICKQVLCPNEAEPNVADGDTWQTNLVFTIRGVVLSLLVLLVQKYNY
jgi:hypothetical protein